MERPLCYDVTRLLTRVLNATPNGIDRVDVSLAQHLLGADGPRFGAVSTGIGTRLMSAAAAREAVAGIAAHWGEEGARDADPVFDGVAAWIGGRPAPVPRGNFQPVAARRPTLRADIAGGLAWARRHGLPLFRRPEAALPRGSLYLNASQFPLWVPGAFAWLKARRDVRAAFFIHDLLPLTMPEYFPPAEAPRHRRRLETFARFAAAGLVTTRTVAEDLRAHLAPLGRADMPIFVGALPVAPTFTLPRTPDPALAGHPYFVLCSTIEPRKNHLMILAAWRALVGRHGAAAPKLVLVGTMGWHYDLIMDLVRRSPALQSHVLHVSGLSTPGLKRLVDGARAVLMPTFGEGYGLPVHEALAAGAPVVASDIPAFREIGAAGLTLLPPLDGEAWLEGVARLAATERPASVPPPAPAPDDYQDRLQRFLAAL